MIQILLLVIFLASSVTGDPNPFLKKYLDAMEDGLKCHKGYATFPQSLKDAAAKCAEKKEITDYTCYLICVYHEFGYFTKDDKGALEVDHGLASLITGESIDLNTKPGRKSFWDLVKTRYDCAQTHLVKNGVQIPDTYDNKAKCVAVKDFFNCSFKSWTCGKHIVD